MGIIIKKYLEFLEGHSKQSCLISSGLLQSGIEEGCTISDVHEIHVLDGRKKLFDVGRCELESGNVVFDDGLFQIVEGFGLQDNCSELQATQIEPIEFQVLSKIKTGLQLLQHHC